MSPPKPEAPLPQQPHRRGRVIALVAALVVLVIAIPRVLHSLRTVSTDDAYVNSHATFVAPRVIGQVARVLVDDNNRVRKGDALVELDSEPYRVQSAIKQAAVDAAQAELVVAEANVRSQVGQARGFRFKLQHAIEDVDNQVALLRARVATLDQSKATLTLAQTEFDRAKKLRETKVTSAEEFDQKREALEVAQAKVQEATEAVYQQRAALGLKRDPEVGKGLTDVPPDLDQNFSAVREALAELIRAAAQLGVVPRSYDLTPKQLLEEFYKRDAGGDVDKIYAEIIKTAPALKQAQTKLQQAQRDLDQAQLDLRYCTIVAEIDGVVTRRNVNPGNHVQVGQSLMAIRSLREIWVDANFKETQLRDLRIGQRAELKVDMYGHKRTFEGRVSGFTMGTGSTLALLPPQNATGNFVKVVQRLPVRIDLLNYDPEKTPLFVGVSVEPEVDIKSAPTGPNAGKYLQETTEPAARP
ncbi:MAG: rane fusion protein multidrug efflux system [Chthoniobacter sp.]|nr:rane fusion protein multidrug efflux system [Chthoniobacter sp.]